MVISHQLFPSSCEQVTHHAEGFKGILWPFHRRQTWVHSWASNSCSEQGFVLVKGSNQTPLPKHAKSRAPMSSGKYIYSNDQGICPLRICPISWADVELLIADFDRFVNGLWQPVVRSQQARALGIATASWKTGRKMSKKDLQRLKVEREAMLSILGFNPRMSKHQKGALKTYKCGSNRSYWMFRKHRDWKEAWKLESKGISLCKRFINFSVRGYHGPCVWLSDWFGKDELHTIASVTEMQRQETFKWLSVLLTEKSH